MSGREYSVYVLVQIIGAAINLVIFVVIIELVPDLAQIPVIPLAVGAIAGLLFNFTASSLFVFRSKQLRQ
jgi:putative flippase GtrA